MKTELKKDTYTIGTVAAILGISPDTLRYYEKRGLVASQKLDNGYRYYTDEDLRNLLEILYYRKMDISLSSMKDLLKHNGSTDYVEALLDQRIFEEEQEIGRRRQNITRLKLAKLQGRRTRDYQKGFSLRPFPKAYIIDRCSSSQEIILRWFQRAQEMPGLDMAYFFDEYTLNESFQATYRHSHLLLYQEVAPVIAPEFQLDRYPLTEAMNCVCYSYPTSFLTDPQEMISRMVTWAEERGYSPQGNCLVTNLSSPNGTPAEKVYEAELYLPVSG